jgi:hypothetical protein
LEGITGGYDSEYAIATVEQTKTQAFYEALGRDFTSVWKMPRSEDGYPLLMWEADNSVPPET